LSADNGQYPSGDRALVGRRRVRARDAPGGGRLSRRARLPWPLVVAVVDVLALMVIVGLMGGLSFDAFLALVALGIGVPLVTRRTSPGAFARLDARLSDLVPDVMPPALFAVAVLVVALAAALTLFGGRVGVWWGEALMTAGQAVTALVTVVGTILGLLVVGAILLGGGSSRPASPSPPPSAVDTLEARARAKRARRDG
jgi:hypothetical protein